ncbi:hypothetical protein BT93_L1897 [Corymbia citriodora subsp. variegata]|uniref:Uncharacterized protein n=1 Tax=Corymbia citriodora subsp. variegata TaxID=360336 RepID=A0A8T0CNW1_CORYI|nr:hypothetical protein BT93_L1897 [Corymbia citriodora subsp. variegata]
MKLFSIRSPFLFLSLLDILLLAMQPRLSRADVGTAAHYSPPYTPTTCFGNDPSQFPSSNLFAAAGEGIWDNGASCGRQYLVRCISASVSGTCIPSQTIQVRIVDRALSSSSSPSSNGYEGRKYSLVWYYHNSSRCGGYFHLATTKKLTSAC